MIEENKVINSFWLGEINRGVEATRKSFTKHGHTFKLWGYNNPELEDASKIMSFDEFKFYKRERCSAALGANLFRYKLLYELGGWWVDCDVICLKPFDFASPYVFAREKLRTVSYAVNNGIIKAPAKTRFFENAIQEYNRTVTTEGWGRTGSELLTGLIKYYKFEDYVLPVETFCPLSWWEAAQYANYVPTTENYALHWWHNREDFHENLWQFCI